MKPSSLLFWLIPPALGLFAGWQLKKPGPEVESHAEPGESSLQIHAISRADQHSSSSVQSSTGSGAFTSLPLGDSYQEWFLFLSGVSAEDFPGLYQEFQERPTRSRDLTRLFFLHWTRIDPGSAIEAARQAGDSDLRTAYHMWACHDPGTALATALARNDPAYQVAWGIGEFHPAWLEENWDELTMELASNLPIGQISAWLDDERFTQREGFSIVLFSKLLEQRLLQERPGLFLERKLSKGNRLSRDEMEHFAGEHLALYLDHLESLEDPEKRGTAIRSLAMIRPDLAPAELLKLNPQKLLSSGDLPGVLRQIALSDLSLLEASLDDLPLSAREVARSAVFEVRLNKYFPGTLSEVLQLPDGLDILYSSQNLSKQSRRLLLEKFSTLPEDWRSKIGERLYLLRGDMKPHEVLETDWTSFGLTAKQAGEITGYALFSQVIETDKENAVDLYAKAALEKDGAQRFLDILRMNGGRETIKELLPHLNARDRRYIVSKMGGEEKINNPVSTPTTATELAAHLATTDPEHDHRMTWTLRKWTPEQKEQFQKDYAAMQGEDRDRLTVMLAKSELPELQTDAVLELLGNDRLQKMAGWDEDRVERTISEVAVGLLKTDSGRAAQWVRALPKGSARSWAIKNLYRNWRNYEPNRAEAFLHSFPPEDRK